MPDPADSPPRPDPPTIRALITLSFIGGAVDAVAFLALGNVFAAVMTGNLLILGFAITTPALEVVGPLASLAAFVLGAAAFGRFDTGTSDRHTLLRRLVRAEGIAVAVAALLLIGYEGADNVQRFAAIAALAGVMGFRNATIRRVAIPELRTTVMTFSIAGFAVDSSEGRGLGSADRLRAAGVVAMVAGAALSALLLREAAPSWSLAMVAIAELAAFGMLGRSSRKRVG